MLGPPVWGISDRKVPQKSVYNEIGWLLWTWYWILGFRE